MIETFPSTNNTNIVGIFKRDKLVITENTINGNTNTGDNNLVDAAIFDITYPNIIPTTEIFELTHTGVYNPITDNLAWATSTDISNAISGDWRVLKSGRTLGTFDANLTIEAIAYDVTVGGCYSAEVSPGVLDSPSFDGVLKIAQTGSTKFGTGGDSSSPVLLKKPSGELIVAGILFAGNCDYVYIVPIYNIASELNISRWDGTCVVAANDSTITINGKTHYRGLTTTNEITHEKD